MRFLKRIRLHEARSLRLSVTLCLLPLAVAAQSAPAGSPRPITSKDFDSWKNISGQVLSPDGRFLAYGLFPEEGDGEVIVRDLAAGPDGGKDLLHIPAGELPPPPVDDPNAEGPPPPRNIKLSFTQDSKTLVFLAYATHGAAEKARKEKSGPAHDELVLLNLTSATPTRVSDVKSFQVPAKGDGFIAYLKYGPPAPRPTAAALEAGTDDAGAAPENGQTGRGRSSAAGAATPASQFGSQMLLRKLSGRHASGSFPDVLEYAARRRMARAARLLGRVREGGDGRRLRGWPPPAASRRRTHHRAEAATSTCHLRRQESDSACLRRQSRRGTRRGLRRPASPLQRSRRTSLYLWKTLGGDSRGAGRVGRDCRASIRAGLIAEQASADLLEGWLQALLWRGASASAAACHGDRSGQALVRPVALRRTSTSSRSSEVRAPADLNRSRTARCI